MKAIAAALMMLAGASAPALSQTATTNPVPVPGSRQQDAPNVVKPTDSTRSEPQKTEQVPPNAQPTVRTNAEPRPETQR